MKSMEKIFGNRRDISIEEQQILPKIVFGQDPTLSNEQEPHSTKYDVHQTPVHTTPSQYKSLQEIADSSSGFTDSRVLLKNIGRCLLRAQQRANVAVPLSPSKIFVQIPVQIYSTEDTEDRIDMISLANVYCYILTKGKCPEYSENLTEKDVVHFDPHEAIDSLKLMTDNETLPSIEDVLKHPFYWNEPQKLWFIRSACDFLIRKSKHEEGKHKAVILQKYHMLEATDVIPENWIEKLKLTQSDINIMLKKSRQMRGFRLVFSKDIIYNMCLKQKYGGKNIFELVRFIRNQYLYYHRNSPSVKLAFGSYPIGLWNFFSSRFPKLFMHVYQNVKLDILSEQKDVERIFEVGFQYDEPSTSGSRTHRGIEKHVFSPSKDLAEKIQDVGIDTERYSKIDAESADCDSGYYPLTTASSYVDEEEPRAEQTFEDWDDTSVYPTYEEECSNNNAEIDLSQLVSALDLRHSLLDRHRNTTIRFKTPIPWRSGTASIRNISVEESKKHCNKHENHAITTEESMMETDSKMAECENEKHHEQELGINIGNKVYTIEKNDVIDVSYNKTISSDEFRELGDLIITRNLKTLIAVDCDITHDKLQNLSEGLKDGKLKQLDMSCSKNLTSEGFELLAKFVLTREVETLIITSCEINRKTLEAFSEPLLHESNALKELDLSYNPTLEPDAYEIVSLLVVKCEMRFLGLTGCKMSASHLNHLKFTQHTKINMDMSDNVFLGRGITRLSEMANECQVQELNISDCMVTANQLRLFREGLKETKVCRMHLSDYDRRPGEEYIREICELLPHITEVLYLQFKSLSTHCQLLLQEKLNMQTERSTKIILSGRTIVWQQESERNT